jgi:hypothetical protein
MFKTRVLAIKITKYVHKAGGENVVGSASAEVSREKQGRAGSAQVCQCSNVLLRSSHTIFGNYEM